MIPIRARTRRVALTVMIALGSLRPGTAVAQTAPTIHTVELQEIQFLPRDLTLRVGDTVRWVWITGFHNVESGGVNATGDGVFDGRFRSGDPVGTEGTTFDWRFDQAFLDANPSAGRVFPYYCVVHAFIGMVGTITVAECLSNDHCADSNPCTDDRCDAGVCIRTNNAFPCDDLNPCTSSDACAGGACAGTPVSGCCRAHGDCNDGNPCTSDSCENGVCRAAAGPAVPCDDGDRCTTGDVCGNGICAGTPVEVCCQVNPDCDDDNVCTDDRCEVGACVHAPNSAVCNDGDVCTTDDVCGGGVCSGEAISGCCIALSDCPDSPCVEVRCINRRCVDEPIEGCITCDADADCDDDDPCTDDECAADECRHAFNAAACDDGNDCTVDDACIGGQCAGATVAGCCVVEQDCADDDPCTTDSCVESRCEHSAIDGCVDHAGPDHPPDDDTDPGAEVPAPRNPPGPTLCGIATAPILVLAAFGRIGIVRRRSVRLCRQGSARQS